MAIAGDLNKVDGDVLYAADVTALLNMQGKGLQIYSNSIWNESLIGFDADLVQQLDNYSYSTLTSTNEGDSSGDIQNKSYIGAESIDEHNDSSIDSNLWTTATSNGTATEDTTDMSLAISININSGYATAEGDGINSIDFNQNSSMYLTINLTGNNVSTQTNRTAEIILVDDSANEVVIWSENANNKNVEHDIRIDITPGTNNAQLYLDDIHTSGAGTSISISSLTDGDTWHLKYKVSGNHSGGGAATTTASINIFSTRFVNSTSPTQDFIFNFNTSGTTINNAVFVDSHTFDGSGSATYYLSADNGSNWEAIELMKIHNFTNTGTQLKLKVELTSSLTGTYQINHCAVQYNLY